MTLPKKGRGDAARILTYSAAVLGGWRTSGWNLVRFGSVTAPASVWRFPRSRDHPWRRDDVVHLQQQVRLRVDGDGALSACVLSRPLMDSRSRAVINARCPAALFRQRIFSASVSTSAYDHRVSSVTVALRTVAPGADVLKDVDGVRNGDRESFDANLRHELVVLVLEDECRRVVSSLAMLCSRT